MKLLLKVFKSKEHNEEIFEKIKIKFLKNKFIEKDYVWLSKRDTIKIMLSKLLYRKKIILSHRQMCMCVCIYIYKHTHTQRKHSTYTLANIRISF